MKMMRYAFLHDLHGRLHSTQASSAPPDWPGHLINGFSLHANHNMLGMLGLFGSYIRSADRTLVFQIYVRHDPHGYEPSLRKQKVADYSVRIKSAQKAAKTRKKAHRKPNITTTNRIITPVRVKHHHKPQ
jgi:hypothetical protein